MISQQTVFPESYQNTVIDLHVEQIVNDVMNFVLEQELKAKSLGEDFKERLSTYLGAFSAYLWEKDLPVILEADKFHANSILSVDGEHGDGVSLIEPHFLIYRATGDTCVAMCPAVRITSDRVYLCYVKAEMKKDAGRQLYVATEDRAPEFVEIADVDDFMKAVADTAMRLRSRQ